MTDAEEFILSIYKLIKELSITNISKVCLVRNTINNKQYIMRILPKDCRPVYSVLKNSLFSGVPTIYEVIYNGNTTIVEEYIEGTPLSDIAQSTISYESFSNYMTELMHVVSALHSINIIHRDIKEDNILIRPDNTVVLIDFAISKIISSGNTPNNDDDTLGSFTYAAPEQFGLAPTDKRSDIYSLGIVCKNLIKKCLDMPPTLQNTWEHIINKCTDFSPEIRFQAIDEIINLVNQPAFFYGSHSSHIIKFNIPSIPPCVQIYDNEEKSLFKIMEYDTITIKDNNGTISIKCTNNSSEYDYIIFEPRNISPQEKTLTEIFFLPDLILMARAFYYPCHTINNETKIVNYYQLRYINIAGNSINCLSNIYENLTGFTILGDYEMVMDNDTLVCYPL